jgi:PPP family 3-phenylpropionic acid transporter
LALTSETTDRRDLWSVRLYYFTWIGGGGFLFPFITLFYRQQGLSGTEIGWLSTVGAIVALIAAPWWGRLSDRVTRPQRLAQLGLIASAAFTLLLGQQTVFGWMVVIVSVETLMSAGVSPLSDMLALNVMHGNEHSGFGSIRLWGSLGWAVMVLLAGGLIERYSLQSAFVGYAILLLLSVWFMNLLRYRATAGAENASLSPGFQLHADWRRLLRDRPLMGLALALAFVWFATNGLRQFEAVYMKSLGAGESLIGLASTIGASIELPAMLWADRLVRRYGAGRILQISFLLDVIRFIAVLLIPAVPTILFSRAVGGISFSFYVVALTLFIRDHSPLGHVATMLAIFTVTLPSLINIIGGPAGGWAFDQFGAYWLYAISAIGTILAWLAMRWGSGHR